MNAIQVIEGAFDDVHRALQADIAEVDSELLWWQPQPGYNHIGFLFWHLVRDEDVVVSYVTKQPELWAAGGWYDRLGLPRESQGTGLDPAGMATFRYDLSLFMEYAGSVWSATGPRLAALTDADLDAVAWPGSEMTVASQLVEGSACHNWVHLGEIRAIKGLRGWRFRE